MAKTAEIAEPIVNQPAKDLEVPQFNKKEVEGIAKDVATNVATEVIKSGEVDNAKPIYCHPVHLYCSDDGRVFRLTCLIFNNDATPFTLATFKTWFDNLVSSTSNRARLMASGGTNKIKTVVEETASTKLLIVSSIDKTAAGTYIIAGVDTDGLSNSFADQNFNVVFPASTELIDGVNKIN